MILDLFLPNEFLGVVYFYESLRLFVAGPLDRTVYEESSKLVTNTLFESKSLSSASELEESRFFTEYTAPISSLVSP